MAQPNEKTELEDTGAVQQPEQWSASDDPSLFSANLERHLSALPDQGEASTIPWAGSYWPTAEDNINLRWDGPASMSPSKKYEEAFNLTGVEDAVSQYHGIDSRSFAKSCTQSTECNSSLGEICAKRTGATSGRCIPTWFGICHAWAPAAILIPEPQHEVVQNGVTFKVEDIKALVSLVHNSTTTKFLSLRCDSSNTAGEVTYDQYGRPMSDCRDTNAGTFHIVLSNYLGIQKKSFVEDRTFDFEVWNQPLRGYKVLEQKAITAQKANQLVGVKAVGETTQQNSGTVLASAWSNLPGIPVAAGEAYSVKMTGTGDADLYVRFESAPTVSSYDCRPYTGNTAEECGGTAPAGATTMYVSVNGYAPTSDFALTITSGGTIPATYVFNAKAKSWVYMKTDVSYIFEASSSTDGNLSSIIDSYTGHDIYESVLELDADGVIIGGEWLGSSKKNHPDFLWLPTGPGSTTVAGGAISYANVKAIADASIAPVGPVVPVVHTIVNQSDTVTAGAFKHYGPFKVAVGTNLNAKLTGTSGDADLYVRNAAEPTTSLYDCRPYASVSNETCDVTATSDVYVSVHGYAASSDYALSIDYTPAN